MSRVRWPIFFGLLNDDSLWILPEELMAKIRSPTSPTPHPHHPNK